MNTKLSAQVEKLVAWQIEALSAHTTIPSVEEVITALRRGQTNTSRLPVSHEAIDSLRKRSDAAKRKLILKMMSRHNQPGAAPGAVAESSSEAAQFQPPANNVLAIIARRSSLELKEEEPGEVYIPLRAFHQLIGKRPEHLRRTLASRKLPLRDIKMLNERGELRDTPAIHVSYLPLVIGMADTHRVSEEGRERLFALQREMPNWSKRLNQVADSNGVLYARPKDEPRSILGALVNTVMTRVANALSSGLGKLEQKLDMRFDRLERILLLDPKTPQKTSLPETPQVETRRTTVTGGSKFSVRRPTYDIQTVVNHVNQYVGMSYTPEDIIQMAKEAGIYERAPWGFEQNFEPFAVRINDGLRVTWQFDLDSVELLKELARLIKMKAVPLGSTLS